MKLFLTLPFLFLITAVSAWQVRFVGEDGNHIDAHGTQDTSCNMLKWESRQNVRLVSFNPATDWYVDPEHVYVYSDGGCSKNSYEFSPGDTTTDVLGGSYIVE